MAKAKSKRATSEGYSFTDDKISRIGGGFTYRMKFDPRFYARVNAAQYFVFALIAAGIGVWFGNGIPLIIASFFLFISLCYVFFGAAYKRYDLGNTADYCRRIHPTWNETQIFGCVEKREQYEDIKNNRSRGDGGFGGLLVGSSLRNR